MNRVVHQRHGQLEAQLGPMRIGKKNPVTVKESGAQKFLEDWVSNFLFQIYPLFLHLQTFVTLS
jgi:hypothetical protein